MIVKSEDLYIHNVNDLLEWMGKNNYVSEMNGGFSRYNSGHIIVYSPPDLGYILQELKKVFVDVEKYYETETLEEIIRDVVWDRMYGYMIYSRG